MPNHQSLELDNPVTGGRSQYSGVALSCLNFSWLRGRMTRFREEHRDAHRHPRLGKNAGLPNEKSIRKGVHNLRHAFGRRLRSAGVPLETRKALLGHANGDITNEHRAEQRTRLLESVGIIPPFEIEQAFMSNWKIRLKRPDSHTNEFPEYPGRFNGHSRPVRS